VSFHGQEDYIHGTDGFQIGAHLGMGAPLASRSPHLDTLILHGAQMSAAGKQGNV
jgi:hypothetical protein